MSTVSTPNTAILFAPARCWRARQDGGIGRAGTFGQARTLERLSMGVAMRTTVQPCKSTVGQVQSVQVCVGGAVQSATRRATAAPGSSRICAVMGGHRQVGCMGRAGAWCRPECRSEAQGVPRAALLSFVGRNLPLDSLPHSTVPCLPLTCGWPRGPRCVPYCPAPRLWARRSRREPSGERPCWTGDHAQGHQLHHFVYSGLAYGCHEPTQSRQRCYLTSWRGATAVLHHHVARCYSSATSSRCAGLSLDTMSR